MIEELEKLLNEFISHKYKFPSLEMAGNIISSIKSIILNSYLLNFDNTIMYNHYYDYTLTSEENIEYFESCNSNPDNICGFALYGLIERFKEMLEIISGTEFTQEEINELLKSGREINNIYPYVVYIRMHINKINEKKRVELPFLNDCKYKIFFSGTSYNDIKKLQKSTTMQLIKKIFSPLAISDVIPLAEGCDHVNDKYGTSFFRIQFADDYRIVYERVNGVTIILSIFMKTGKNIDYFALDSIAAKNNIILGESELFLKGISTNIHTDTIKYLDNLYKKEIKKKNEEPDGLKRQ